MANIVKSYGVGRLFREGDFESLSEEFLLFRDEYKKYRKNIEKFKQAFSKETSSTAVTSLNRFVIFFKTTSVTISTPIKEPYGCHRWWLTADS